jgi:DNA polymerase/3'-5' exonuclease PolX
MQDILNRIRRTESPFKRQPLMVTLRLRLLKQGYLRKVYFTSDIDLAYPIERHWMRC